MVLDELLVQEDNEAIVGIEENMLMFLNRFLFYKKKNIIHIIMDK